MSVWDEHADTDGGVPADDDAGSVLEPVMEDVLHSEVEPARKASSRGKVNPRLLAVLMMVVVLGAAGFAVIKMKAKSANRADEAAVAVDAPASTDPVMQPGLLSANPQPNPGLLAPPAGEPAAPPPGGGLMVVSPDAAGYVQPASGAAPVQAVNQGQPAPQPAHQQVSGPDPQVEQLKEQLRNLGADMARLVDDNNGLREELGKARLAAKTAEQKQKTQPAEKNSSPPAQHAKARPSRPSQPETKSASVAKKPAAAGKRGVADEDIITEKRESRLASLSVRAIYPMNGRNARAWINVDDDVVEVSAGSTVAGAYVKSVNPDSMEVVTDAGVIRARR